MALVWLIHIGIIAWLIRQFHQLQHQPEINRYFWYGMVLKLLGGVAFGLFYQYQIDGGDTWNFFENSKILAQWGTANLSKYLPALVGGPVPDELVRVMGYEAQPRALLMSKILSVFTIVTAGNYWLTGIYLSLFAFTGSWMLVARIATHYEKSKTAALAAFIFLPSAIFWGAGVSKEAIYLGGFGYLAAWFWPYFPGKIRLVQWIAGMVMLVVLFHLKYYYIAVFVPVLAATMINNRIPVTHHHWWLVHLRWLAVFVLLLFTLSWFHPNLRLNYVAEVVSSNAEAIAQISTGSALIDFQAHPNAAIWMGLNLPWATFTGLLRPNFGDWGSFYQNIAVLEHMVITIFLLGSMRFLFSWNFQKADWLPCLVYVLLLSGLLTLATPNFGTLVRYKVSFLPVFVFLVLYQNRWWDRLVVKLP